MRRGSSEATRRAKRGLAWRYKRRRERPRRPRTGNVTGERTCGLQAECGRAALGAGRRAATRGSTADTLAFAPATVGPVSALRLSGRAAVLGEERQLQPGGSFEPRIERLPRGSHRRRDNRCTGSGEPCRGRRGVVDLERQPDVTGDPSSDLDLVDECRVTGIGDLERRSAAIEDDDAPIRGGEGRLFGQAQGVAIEADGFVIVGRGDDDTKLMDHGAVDVRWIGIAHGDSLPAPAERGGSWPPRYPEPVGR